MGTKRTIKPVKRIKVSGKYAGCGCGYCGQTAPGGYLFEFQACGVAVCSVGCLKKILGEEGANDNDN